MVFCEAPAGGWGQGEADREGDLLPEWLPSGSEHRSFAGCVSAEDLRGPGYLTVNVNCLGVNGNSVIFSLDLGVSHFG